MNYYGEVILSNLTNYNLQNFDFKSDKLYFEEEKKAINEFIIKYRRSKRNGCQNPKCFKAFGKDFLIRPQEFSAWLGYLDFKDNNPAKSIMMIGEAAGPAISTSINIPYGLGNLYINEEGVMENENTLNLFEDLKTTEIEPYLDELIIKSRRKIIKLKDLPDLEKKMEIFRENLYNHNLWDYTYRLFKERFLDFLNNLYLTDLVKCNLSGNVMWKNCKKECQKLAYNEINLILPRIILFLGGQSHYQTKKLLKKNNITISPVIENLNEYFSEEFLEFLKFEKFILNNNEILMFKLYHNKRIGNYMSKESSTKFIKECRKFIVNEMYPILNW